MIRRNPRVAIAAAGALGAIAALALSQAYAAEPAKPLTLAPQVDVQRYMGAWYVIGFIPTYFDKDAYNGVERYTLKPDGKIDTVFSYRDGSFDAKEKTMHSTATVKGGNGAIWGVQFVWPFQADYRIMYLADDYSTVVVGREKRDYVWIMSRQPAMPEAEYQKLAAMVAAEGYDTSKLVKAPQRW